MVEFNVWELLRRRAVITGSTLRARPVAFKAEIAGKLRECVWPLISAGRIRPVIARLYPAARAAEAHALMESNGHIGKIVLCWTSSSTKETFIDSPVESGASPAVRHGVPHWTKPLQNASKGKPC